MGGEGFFAVEDLVDGAGPVGLQRSFEVGEKLRNQGSGSRRRVEKQDFGVAAHRPQMAALDAAWIIVVEHRQRRRVGG